MEVRMPDPIRSQSPASLAADALRISSDLVRKEVTLAKAELRQNLNRAGTGLGMIVAAAVLGIVTLNVLTVALVAALAETDLGPIWSAVVVGVVLAILAYVLLRKGMADLKPENLMPTRAVENVQRDASAVKEAYHDA